MINYYVSFLLSASIYDGSCCTLRRCEKVPWFIPIDCESEFLQHIPWTLHRGQITGLTTPVGSLITPTDRPKSGVCVLSFCFRIFCWYRGFCRRTESDLLLFLLQMSLDILDTILITTNIHVKKCYDISALDGCRSLFSIWRLVYTCLNIRPLVSGSGKVMALNKPGFVTVVDQTDRPRSVRSRYVIECFCSVCVFILLCIFCPWGLFVTQLR